MNGTMNKVIFIGKDGKTQILEVGDFGDVTLKIQDGRLVMVEQLTKIKPTEPKHNQDGGKTLETLINQLNSSFPIEKLL